MPGLSAGARRQGWMASARVSVWGGRMALRMPPRFYIAQSEIARLMFIQTTYILHANKTSLLLMKHSIITLAPQRRL